MEFDNPREVEAHKGVLALVTEAFKYLALANGGAAVAVLSKLGADGSIYAPERALAPFAFGLMACGCSVLVMLMAEMLLLHQRPDSSKQGRSSRAVGLHVLACIGIFASTLFFAYGCGVAVTQVELARAKS